MPIKETATALNWIKKELLSIGLNLEGIILIEDPAAIDNKRLRSEMLLAGADPDSINILFKEKTLMSACRLSDINCHNSRRLLRNSNFYLYDNHLNESGGEVFSSYIANIVSSKYQ